MKLHWIRNKGFYIQVITGKKNQIEKKSLPPHFRKITKLKNGFNFVTKEFVMQEGLARNGMDDICRMSSAVFNELLGEVREHIGFLYKLNDTLALLDLVTTFATVSMSMDYVKPDFGERVFIKAGRHPILEQSSLEVIPNDCNMSDESRIHILSGANMSGKSTYLRQVVLITVMAQIGCFVPAEMATVRICDRIFSRISNRDCLESNSSTFMLEMLEIAFILTNVTEHSIVILDELGRGTSVQDGTAVCWAVCEELLSVGCLVFLATHFSNMNFMSDLHPYVQSYHFHLSSELGEQVTTHQLIRGGLDVTQTRYGIDVAKKIQFPLPDPLIERAKELYRNMSLNRRDCIDKIDVISAKHFLMLRQLVIHNIEGDDLKTALQNIRCSFVTETENLPEVDIGEDDTDDSDSSCDESNLRPQSEVKRKQGIFSLHLSEKSGGSLNSLWFRGDTENQNHGTSRGHDISNLQGHSQGRGLFEDEDELEDDSNRLIPAKKTKTPEETDKIPQRDRLDQTSRVPFRHQREKDLSADSSQTKESSNTSSPERRPEPIVPRVENNQKTNLLNFIVSGSLSQVSSEDIKF